RRCQRLARFAPRASMSRVPASTVRSAEQSVAPDGAGRHGIVDVTVSEARPAGERSRSAARGQRVAMTFAYLASLQRPRFPPPDWAEVVAAVCALEGAERPLFTLAPR